MADVIPNVILDKYCDRTSELHKCAELIRQKVLSGRLKLKTRPTSNILDVKLPESSIYNEIFIPLLNEITTNISQTSVKMNNLKLMTAEYELKNFGQHNQFALQTSRLVNIIQEDILEIQSGIKKMLQLLPQITREYKSRHQLYIHAKAMVLTIECRFVDLSGNLREYMESQKGNLTDCEDKESNSLSSNQMGIVVSSSDQYVNPSHVNIEYTQQSIKAPAHLIQFNNSLVSSSKEMYCLPQSGNKSINSFHLTSQSNPSSSVSRMDSSPSQHQLQMSLLEEVPPQHSIVRQRDAAIRSVEQTIVHLGEIYEQFSYLVKEQGDTVHRIDAFTEEASLDLNLAHDYLVQFLREVSNRRSLILKFFAILLTFFFIFAIFMR